MPCAAPMQRPILYFFGVLNFRRSSASTAKLIGNFYFGLKQWFHCCKHNNINQTFLINTRFMHQNLKTWCRTRHLKQPLIKHRNVCDWLIRNSATWENGLLYTLEGCATHSLLLCKLLERRGNMTQQPTNAVQIMMTLLPASWAASTQRPILHWTTSSRSAVEMSSEEKSAPSSRVTMPDDEPLRKAFVRILENINSGID